MAFQYSPQTRNRKNNGRIVDNILSEGNTAKRMTTNNKKKKQQVFLSIFNTCLAGLKETGFGGDFQAVKFVSFAFKHCTYI